MLDTVPLLFTRYFPPSKLSCTAGGIILVSQTRTAMFRVPCPFVQRLAETALDLRSELKPRIVALCPGVTSQLCGTETAGQDKHTHRSAPRSSSSSACLLLLFPQSSLLTLHVPFSLISILLPNNPPFPFFPPHSHPVLIKNWSQGGHSEKKRGSSRKENFPLTSS